LGIVEGQPGRRNLGTSIYATKSVENVCKAATQPVGFQLAPTESSMKTLFSGPKRRVARRFVVTVDAKRYFGSDEETPD
jgi:hypothetical protein